ncbi:actin cytoskeleton and mitosis protein [Coemansia javaensis]|uniref:Actin cytoskeleton and mitosis protein n=1 Tax=Coemansia javaensis TaxID=2761396 RepID=A0A9W8H5Q2_9FUNG|nr:actin cytoskeleton and mitosis protein [Coemansia javaensis]
MDPEWRSEEEEARLKALRRERFKNTEAEERYRRLVAERAVRRKQLEQQGALGRQGALAEARKIVGTCTLMCPEFEREERELKNNIAALELVPGTRRADPARTVKTFHRSAAGNEEPLPEDLRTAETLTRTLDHLVNVVIGEDPGLQRCHGFVRDRTRSIRQDFTIQNIRDQTTVAACERIARFHIVSLHVLCGNRDFAEHQDMEQLRNTLKTLIELYDDHRRAGQRCGNEAEFYAYYIAAHLHDPDAKRVAERLPAHIFTAPVVQQALRLHMLAESSGTVGVHRDPGNQFAAQNLATQFFRAVAAPETPLLLACLAEYRFPSIRRAALKAMCDAFPYQDGKEYPTEEFAAMLAFDSADEAHAFCRLFGVACTAAGVKLGERVAGALVYREPAQRPRPAAPNLRVVGSKFHMSPMQAINDPLPARFLAASLAPALVASLATTTTTTTAAASAPLATLTFKPPVPAVAASVSAPAASAAPAASVASPARSANAFATAFATGHGGVFGAKPPLPAAEKGAFALSAGPAPPAVVWNRPRHRINWVSLTNALYDSLVGSLARDIAQPVVRHAARCADAADAVAGDIAQSIIDYTAAFIAYEEAYRCVLLGRADAFRRQAVLRAAVSRWSMESVARQQDRARQQRQQDDLDEILDSEYMGDRLHPDDIFGLASPARALPLPPPPPATPQVPGGFWESARLGPECFDMARRVLARFGSPGLCATVDVAGSSGAAVLPSWLWWQIDPAAIDGPGRGLRAVSYADGAQTLAFRELPDDGPESPGGGHSTSAARVVVLSPEPVGAADAHGLAGDISAHVRAALDWARSSHSGPTPVLFALWGSDERGARAARRAVERALGASGVPGHVATSVLAMDIAMAKVQLGAGLRWLCRHVIQARKATLVRAPRAYAAVADALLRQLQHMRTCALAAAAAHGPIDDGAAVAVFNMAAETANAFVALVNEHFLRSAGRTAELYPPITALEAAAGACLGSSGSSSSSAAAPDAAATAALVGDILATPGPDQPPLLGACLRALEVSAKHRLDALRCAVPEDAYADRRAVADATRAAVRLAEVHAAQAAHLCQSAAPATPAPRRTPAMPPAASPAPVRTPVPHRGFAPMTSPAPHPPGSPSSVASRSTAASKRRRPGSARKIARLQSAIERASRQLQDQ